MYKLPEKARVGSAPLPAPLRRGGRNPS